MYKDSYSFSKEFITNINDLYYLDEIEVAFNPDKIKMHYGTAFTDTLNVKEDVDSSLVDYVRNNLPKSLKTDLEKAIGIYILLAKVLRYAPIYTITEEIYDKVDYLCIDEAYRLVIVEKRYGKDSRTIKSGLMFIDFIKQFWVQLLAVAVVGYLLGSISSSIIVTNGGTVTSVNSLHPSNEDDLIDSIYNGN